MGSGDGNQLKMGMTFRVTLPLGKSHHSRKLRPSIFLRIKRYKTGSVRFRLLYPGEAKGRRKQPLSGTARGHIGESVRVDSKEGRR